MRRPSAHFTSTGERTVDVAILFPETPFVSKLKDGTSYGQPRAPAVRQENASIDGKTKYTHDVCVNKLKRSLRWLLLAPFFAMIIAGSSH